MEKAINEAIATINDEIAELTNRRNLLQNIETSELSDAEKWCLLRETPLRGDKDGMLKLAETFIPGADEYIYDVNEVKIRMGLIDARIPTNNDLTIDLSYRGMLVKKYPELEEASYDERFLKGYINLLESNASDWTLMRYRTPKMNSMLRCISFCFLNKKKLRDIESVKSQYERIRDERYAKGRKLLEAYTIFGNEVCRFDALMYHKIIAFAGNKFKVQRNGIYY